MNKSDKNEPRMWVQFVPDSIYSAIGSGEKKVDVLFQDYNGLRPGRRDVTRLRQRDILLYRNRDNPEAAGIVREVEEVQVGPLEKIVYPLHQRFSSENIVPGSHSIPEVMEYFDHKPDSSGARERTAAVIYRF
jgi:hypothetical protein